jgi:hypothetical protein
MKLMIPVNQVVEMAPIRCFGHEELITRHVVPPSPLLVVPTNCECGTHRRRSQGVYDLRSQTLMITLSLAMESSNFGCLMSKVRAPRILRLENLQ